MAQANEVAALVVARVVIDVVDVNGGHQQALLLALRAEWLLS